MVKAVVTLLALALAMAVNAGTTLGVYENAKTGAENIDIYTCRDFSSHSGAFAYASVSENWSEAYVGPTFSPNANIQVGLGLGVESGQSSARLGGFAWAGQGKAFATLLFEDGGSGPWHKLKAGYQVTTRVNAQVLEKSAHGLGLGVECKLDNSTRLTVETFGNEGTTVGVKLSF